MAFDTELSVLISERRPLLLAVGEPYHGEPAFPRLRNRILETLAGHGFRSIVIESDRAAGLAVDDYVRGRRDDLDLSTGVSHDWGTRPATRELVDWLRAHNTDLPPEDRVALHGFDAPTEITGAPSPGPHLRELRDYLGVPELDSLSGLLGDEARWSAPEIMYDPTRSPGRSPEATALRALAEDLKTMLYAEAPRLIASTSTAAWHRALVLADTAIGLLTYHAAMALPGTRSERIGRLLSVRDAIMARNLLDIVAGERDRGPVLLFAHNTHLQRGASRWETHWEGVDLAAEWAGAGSIVSPLLGDRYVFVAGTLGACPAAGLGTPPPGTYEDLLGPETGIFPPPAEGTERVTEVLGLFSLTAGIAGTCDAVLHIGHGPGAADAARIAGMPGVTETRIEPGSAMPPYTWGDRFFFAAADRMRPFATIVGHDVPDFDERSRLSGTGRYRVNVEVGRDEFRNLFGYGPEEFTAHREKVDFAEPDVLIPHPAYAVQGWVSVVNPGPATAAELERLLTHARTRSAARARRS